MATYQEVIENPIWSPNQGQIDQSNMKAFMSYVEKHCDYPLTTYDNLYEFSIQHPEEFWQSVWDFCGVIGSPGGSVLINGESLEKAQFFPESQLNFAENLLRRRDSDVALEFFGEDRVRQTLTYGELYDQVSQLVILFREWGVQPGDRVAGYLPNMPQTIIALLATATLGAVWSSCSPDFGVNGVVDRFGQINPKIFLSADGYFYNGRTFDCLDKIPEILQHIPSIEKTLIIPYTRTDEEIQKLTSHPVWTDTLNQHPPSEIKFTPLPFNHPLYIMYSSGTTGVPKCIVHGAGGTLLQHLKEHQLHCDIKPGDRLFYFTTCGWMMWNWLVSGLASQASLVLFDGSPTYPHPAYLFDIADQVGVTLFGTSAKYLDALAKLDSTPIKTHDLSSIKMITSTGSPLSPESFDYVYQSIKADVCLASISGGTDIISCFALGNPTAPVWRGELQTRGLGMRVEVFDEEGKAVTGQKGELVCTAPFPSQPISFWNDTDGQKYHNAYFSHFPNVWHHGDFVELTEHKGIIIHGRSDAVLNPGGVRIGTAEIYRQVEQIPEVLESLAVGQNWDNDVRVILFVRLRENVQLDEDLIKKIKGQIRSNTTPRHVPAKVIHVPDIPRTKNGKIAELAVRQIIHGETIKNAEALANPEVLAFYRDIEELKVG